MHVEGDGFTVFVLMYGEHADFARRCLDSILTSADDELVPSIRIGFNAVCQTTRSYVFDALARCRIHETLVYDSQKNVMKYPLMRRMFHDSQYPIGTRYLMWFDDDTYLTSPTSGWWRNVLQHMQSADVVGDLCRSRIRGNQAEGIRAQPWFNGKPISADHSFLFAVGGWWCIRTEIVRHWDYPWRDLRHNGGDTTLGELMRQQGYRLKNFRRGIKVNADLKGRAHRAERRGISQNHVWSDYRPGRAEQMCHEEIPVHVFDLKDCLESEK